MDVGLRREAGSHTLGWSFRDTYCGDTRASVYGLRLKGEARW